MVSVSEPPVSLEPPYPFGQPGKPMLLYAGPLSVALETLPDGTLEEAGKGNVWFQMLPYLRVFWEASVTSTDPDFTNQAFRSLFGAANAEVRILDPRWAESIGTAQEFVMPESGVRRPARHVHENGGHAVRRRCEDSLVSVDLDDPFDIGNGEDLAEIRFSLINFPFMKGNAQVKHHRETAGPDDGVRWYRFDLRTGDGWEVALDVREDFKEVWEQAKEQASYVVTHVGRLRKTDEDSFHFDQAQDILSMLHWFLSFVAGRRVGVALPVGYDSADKVVFARWDSRVTQMAKDPFTWYGENHSRQEIGSLFKSFREFWRKDYWRGVLCWVVYGYNYSKEGHVGDLLMAQSVLEALHWAVFVKEDGKEMISGKEHWVTKNQLKNEQPKRSAADKIRNLLEWAGISEDTPSASDLLDSLSLNRFQSPPDAPAAATWARNRVGHPEFGDGSKVTTEMFVECWWTLLGYIELLFLRLLGYEGVYADRMERYASKDGSFGDRDPYWLGDDIRRVPWATQKGPN